MATAVPFDTLRFARKLETAGFERQQAAETTEALAATDLVTRDYLDAKLREQNLRLDAKLADIKTGMDDRRAWPANARHSGRTGRVDQADESLNTLRA